MPQINIKEIEESLSKTEQGIWFYYNDLKSGYLSCKKSNNENDNKHLAGGFFCEGMIDSDDPNIEFCIKAHNEFIPFLIKKVKELEIKLKKYEYNKE